MVYFNEIYLEGVRKATESLSTLAGRDQNQTQDQMNAKNYCYPINSNIKSEL
jgi:hypothetical protein